MPSYQIAPQDVREFVAEVCAEYQSDLSANGIKFDIIMAHPLEDSEGNPCLPTLTTGGYAVSGKSRILNDFNRTVRGYDAELILDGHGWLKMTQKQQVALIDHMLNYFVVSRSVDGDVIFDRQGRPKLKMRKHDYHFGVFNTVAARHGVDSVELANIRTMYVECGQLYFPFQDEAPALTDGEVEDDSAE